MPEAAVPTAGHLDRQTLQSINGHTQKLGNNHGKQQIACVVTPFKRKRQTEIVNQQLISLHGSDAISFRRWIVRQSHPQHPP